MRGELMKPCPQCGAALNRSERSAWRPFCSERCRLLDLGAWFSEERAIPGSEAGGDHRVDAAGE